MNDRNLFEPKGTTDLSRLNQSERRVLRMLAEGHTVKTIATAFETSPAAVNERLREARRKTGVGSSRELARLLKAQENRDEQIGMARPAGPLAPPGSTSGIPARSSRKGLIAMTALLLTGLVAAAFALQPGAPSNGAEETAFSDPLIGNILAPADPAKTALIPTTVRDYVRPDATENKATALRRLHAQVRAGRRDDAAARELEARLTAIYKQDHPIKLMAAPLRVICSESLCEVATTTDVPTPEPAVNALLSQVQGPTLRQKAEAAGLKPVEVDAATVELARDRSRDMATRNYFSHTTPEGEKFLGMLTQRGVSYKYAGEILARNNYPDAQAPGTAMTTYLNSAPHKAILMDGRYNLVGVGYAKSDEDGMHYFTVIFVQR